MRIGLTLTQKEGSRMHKPVTVQQPPPPLFYEEDRIDYEGGLGELGGELRKVDAGDVIRCALGILILLAFCFCLGLLAGGLWL